MAALGGRETGSAPGARCREDGEPVAGGGRQRWQLAYGFTALAVVTLITLILTPAPKSPFFQGFDTWWHSIATGPAGYRPTGLVWFLNAFGGPQGLVVMLAILIGLGLARRWWAMLFAFAVFTVPMVFAQLLKNLVDRPRPENPLVMVDHGSFPSGHATSTAAFIILVAALLSPAARRYWWPVGIVFVLVMMWSRTFLGAHWLTDTFAGAVLGTGVTLLLWWLFAPLLAGDAARRGATRAARTKIASPLIRQTGPMPILRLPTEEPHRSWPIGRHQRPWPFLPQRLPARRSTR